jgi:CDGSH-type Zn-finger protein
MTAGALSQKLGARSHQLEAVIFITRIHFQFGGLMATVKITVRPNGPYRVEAPEGSIELVDVNGNKYDLTGKPAFSLCRCGGSINKPFCDGTHSKIGFQGAELAVKKAES